MKFTEEQMKKFSEAKSVEEVIAFAKEDGIEASEEEIKKYYNATHIAARGEEGELSDDELDNVAGGACYGSDGRLVVSCGYWCSNWTHYQCGGTLEELSGSNILLCSKCRRHRDGFLDSLGCCATCDSCTVESGTWYCNHRANRR